MMTPRASHDHPIRVAHVALQLDMGGMEKLLVEFGRHADRRRFELYFFSLGDRGVLADQIEACGWPVIALREPAGFRPRLIFRLSRLFHQAKIDLVHTHNQAPLVYAGPAARLAAVRGVIHTRHGRSFGLNGRQIGLFRLACFLANRVVCVSKDSAKLSARQGIPSHKLSRLWNGVDLHRFEYTGPQIDGPALLVARMSPEKDVNTLLQAVAMVVAEYPSFRLQIAGQGPCLLALKDLASKMGITQHVHFLGEVRDVAGLLAGASLFVLPSISEGISLTILEAMARGLPVIATRVGGNPEAVADGETGLLVPPRSPAQLAVAMLQILRNPHRGREMGLAGRRRVELNFDVRRMVAAYESLYLELDGARSRPSTLKMEVSQNGIPIRDNWRGRNSNLEFSSIASVESS